MLTYQIRERAFLTEPLGEKLKFPAHVKASFRLLPRYPYGGVPELCNTVIPGDTPKMYFNANTGRCIAEPQTPMKNVEVIYRALDGKVEISVDGPTITISKKCYSRRELERLLEGYYYLLPLTLNVYMIDPPVIENVTGAVGNTEFCWGISKPDPHKYVVTTVENQEKLILEALKTLPQLTDSSDGSYKRVIAAFHWFHVSCRLAHVGHSPWEFMSEILINYAKILEVLFPSGADKGTIDAAREGLSSLGFSSEEIEAKYIPTIALRNSLDVAHASLAVFTQEELATLFDYTVNTESDFRTLLKSLLEKLSNGSFKLAPYKGNSSKDASRIINRIRDSQNKHKQP